MLMKMLRKTQLSKSIIIKYIISSSAKKSLMRSFKNRCFDGLEDSGKVYDVEDIQVKEKILD